MNFFFFITVILTAVVLVVGAYVVAKLIGPRSYNPVKGEPFECGIPTRGSSWLPSKSLRQTASNLSKGSLFALSSSNILSMQANAFCNSVITPVISLNGFVY